MSPTTDRRYFAFGPYVLDRLRGILWQQGAQVPMTPRVFEVLAALVEHAGELLTKDYFARTIWAGVAVEDNNLARHVSTLRKALHETPDQREYIATVPGVGYRFVAPVTVLAEPPAELMDRAVPSAARPSSEHRGPERSAPGSEPSGPDSPAVAAPVRPAAVHRRLGPAVLAAAGLGIVAVMIGLASIDWPVPSAEPVARSLWQFANEDGREPAFSPDGTQLAFTSSRSGNSDIWVRGFDTSLATRITSSASDDTQPQFSPDGQWIVFRSARDGGGLYLVSSSGGREERIASFGARPMWSPSGSHILFSNATPESAPAVRMYLVGRDGSPPRALDDGPVAGVEVRSAAWHPDGRLSFWGSTPGNPRVFLTMPVENGGQVVQSVLSASVQRQLAEADVDLTNFVWAPSGEYVYFEGESRLVRSLWRVAVDPRTLDWIGGPQRLTTGPGTDAWPAISPDGRRLAFDVTTGRVEVWAYDFDPASGRVTGDAKRLTPGEGFARAEISPDGSRLIYRTRSMDRQEIWERSGDQPPRLLISTADWRPSLPRWSPDATRVVYQRSRSGRAGGTERALAILSVDAAHEPVISDLGTSEVIPTAWSSDGRSILAACRLADEDPLGVCVVPVDERGEAGPVRQVTSADWVTLFQQRFSPDGRWISFMAVPKSDRSVATIYVMPAGGGQWVPVTEGGWYDDKPRWGPDGRTLYFISNRGGRSEVWGRRFDPMAGQPAGDLFRVMSLDQSRLALSPYVGQMDLIISASRIFLPMYEPAGKIWVLEPVDR